ncbi:MAG: hypothetical protein HUJ67_02735 [Ruminiclostridium sp.]|nr:hypothetical protein [Ruminiclostridium sp.]
MNEGTVQFRSATFGGFNRQDVLDYLEQLAQEHQEEISSIVAEKDAALSALEEERKARSQVENRLFMMEQLDVAMPAVNTESAEDSEKTAELEENIAQLEDQVAQLEEEKARLEEEKNRLAKLLIEKESALVDAVRDGENLRESLQGPEDKIASLEAIVEEKTSALVQAEEENAALRSTIAELEPNAKSWEKIRNTAGSIELAAHERAQVTIQNAETQAEDIRAEAKLWVRTIRNRSDSLQKDLHTTVLAVEKQLDSIRASFEMAERDMENFKNAASGLTDGTGEE